MVNNKKYKKSIELFHEKTGEVVRKIRFRNSIAFEEFLKGFRAMRYPGYGWRYIIKGKKRGKNEWSFWEAQMLKIPMDLVICALETELENNISEFIKRCKYNIYLVSRKTSLFILINQVRT